MELVGSNLALGRVQSTQVAKTEKPKQQEIKDKQVEVKETPGYKSAAELSGAVIVQKAKAEKSGVDLNAQIKIGSNDGSKTYLEGPVGKFSYIQYGPADFGSKMIKSAKENSDGEYSTQSDIYSKSSQGINEDIETSILNTTGAKTLQEIGFVKLKYKNNVLQRSGEILVNATKVKDVNNNSVNDGYTRIVCDDDKTFPSSLLVKGDIDEIKKQIADAKKAVQ